MTSDERSGRLSGHVAIISGSAGGQGAGEARLLISQGAQVVVADVDDRAGEALAASLGERAAYCHLDIRSEADWQTTLAVAIDAFGKVTALVNNAGIAPPPSSIIKTPVEHFRNTIEVNLIGAFTGIHVVAPAIVAAGGGSIINISSVNGYIGGWGIAGYSSSKFALRGLTKVAAIELARRGVRVNSIHPGPIDTPMLHSGMPEGSDPVAAMAGAVPAGRVGSVEEVAAMVSFLISDDSSYCYGAEFVVDGGFLAGPRGSPNIPAGARR